MPDGAGQHEMHSSVANLLIMLECIQHVLGSDSVKRRKASERTDGLFDASAIFIRQFMEGAPDASGCDHSVSYRFPLLDSLIPSCCFDSMSDGMTEIQDPPNVAFLFIVHDDVRFDSSALCNQPFDRVRVAFSKHGAASLEVFKQLTVSNDAVLEGFIKTA